MKGFEQYNFKPIVKEGLRRINFINPTPIQELVIPQALKNENMIVQSATGSGKTHAFLLPVVQKINVKIDAVQSLIIAPTRELATQLFDVLNLLLGNDSPIVVSKVVGGVNRETEIKKYQKKQPHIVIGTIGRINDLAIETNVLKIHTANMVIIDEADMIFEQKELQEVDKIIGKIQGKPQFLVFSATIPKGLRIFLNKYLENIKTITLEEKQLTTENINHIMISCKAKDKYGVLKQLLSMINPFLAIIFVNTKDGVDELALRLANDGYRVGKLHGSMDDRIRKQTIKRIHALEYQYIIASDIASRGIDIQGVSHIINFELPNDIEFYIHRTGRTARFNKTGDAYTLYSYDDDEYIKQLKNKGLQPKILKISNGEFVEAKLSPQKKSHDLSIEEEIHQKVPVPKKIKPGYKKKRKQIIEKQIKKIKRERISERYRKEARRKRKENE